MRSSPHKKRKPNASCTRRTPLPFDAAALPTWNAGDTIPLGARTLCVVASPAVHPSDWPGLGKSGFLREAHLGVGG